MDPHRWSERKMSAQTLPIGPKKKKETSLRFGGFVHSKRIRTSNLFGSGHLSQGALPNFSHGAVGYVVLEDEIHAVLYIKTITEAKGRTQTRVFAEAKRVPQPRIELGIPGSQPGEMTIFLLWRIVWGFLLELYHKSSPVGPDWKSSRESESTPMSNYTTPTPGLILMSCYVNPQQTGPLAQVVERWSNKPQVVSSNLTGSILLSLMV